MKPFSFRPPHRQNRGAALVITLFFLALTLLLVVAALDSSAIARRSSTSHLERFRASIMASEGVQQAAAILRKETTDAERNWISSPGALVVPDAIAPPAETPEQKKARLLKLTTEVLLHSGPPGTSGAATGIFAPPNLNDTTFGDSATPSHFLSEQTDATTAKPLEMKTRWVYVRQDGSHDLPNPDKPISATNLPNEVPDLSNQDNPVIGRFAYWADDESSKINYNLAWTREAANTSGPGHPTRVNLMALTGMTPTLADTLHKFITPDDYTIIANRFFNSPLDARGVSSDVAKVLRQNKFDVTHYNHDPDTTFFNQPRIVLTTQKRWSRGRPFLDILVNPGTDTTDGSDPGQTGTAAPYNISPAKLNTVIMGDPTIGKKGLIDYLKRQDWPMVGSPGTSSFQQKYYNTTTDITNLTQFALNIIDYVRSAESTATLVEPIRGIVRAPTGSSTVPTFVPDFQDGSIRGADKTFKGLTRSLYITEFGVWVKSSAEANGRYQCKFFTEIHLPKYSGLDSIDVANVPDPKPTLPGKPLYLYVYAINTANNFYADATTTTNLNGKWFKLDSTTMKDGVTVINAGGHATAVITAYLAPTSGARPASFSLRGALVLGTTTPALSPANRPDPGTQRFEVSPVGQPGSAGTLTYRVDAAGTSENDITSFEVDDPRVNSIAKDWNSVAQAKNSFNAVNKRSTLGKPANTAYVPQQDTDASENITSVSLRIPYKKGHPTNPQGLMLSAGELGSIHTGLEINSAAAKGGVPWRSLRLQPNNQGTNVVPDWAFMDLFTVPVNVPPNGEPMFAPGKTSTGGRVNMNAKAQPFTTERITPLAAVFQGATYDANDPEAKLTAEQADEIAKNIYQRTLAAKGKQYGWATGYDSPGEIVEVKGVADKGEASEELLRQTANLITARGNVFSVYCIGQALKQSRTGGLSILAEQRQHAFMERVRYTDDNFTPLDPADDKPAVKLRTVYFRDMTP